MKYFLTLLLLPIIVLPLHAQKEVKTFHDSQKKLIEENYFVSNEDNSVLVGKYKRFYENGNVMMEGNFDDGKKDGIFIEFHENGAPARKLTYVNGLRHGVVEVYNNEGKPIQKAYYQN